MCDMLEVRQGANLSCSSRAIYMSCIIPVDILELVALVLAVTLIRGRNFVVRNRYW